MRNTGAAGAHPERQPSVGPTFQWTRQLGKGAGGKGRREQVVAVRAVAFD